MRIAVAYGTRPEAIKLAPVILELKKRNVELSIISTGQHKELLEEVEEIFHFQPDHKLEIMKENQSLNEIITNILHTIDPLLKKLNPDLVLVQGDTSTVMAISLACFNLNIRVAHLEAGLRSNNLKEPFPEELNRRIVSLAADLHFAPTKKAKDNLISEGISPEKVFTTGNTIVDAVYLIAKNREAELDSTDKKILVTAHRRENHGEGIQEICLAVNTLAKENPNYHFYWPVHPNPNVKKVVEQELSNRTNINLLPPLSYDKLILLQQDSHLIWTDSGGIQEEAAALRKPVLILRNLTERPEVVESGFGVITGTNHQTIISETKKILGNAALYKKMTSGINPFGDGQSAKIICDLIAQQ
jgi:UDP-N-acetylglucosamine 2-epimerase (non-hydrolysing)